MFIGVNAVGFEAIVWVEEVGELNIILTERLAAVFFVKPAGICKILLVVGELIQAIKDVGEHQSMTNPGEIIFDIKRMRLPDGVGTHGHIYCAAYGFECAFIAGGFIPTKQYTKQ